MRRRFGLRLAVSLLALSVAAAVNGCASGQTQATSPVGKSLSAVAVVTSEPEIAAAHTTAVLRPLTLDGTSPSRDQLDDAATIVARRFAGASLPVPTIVVTSDGLLQLSVPARMTTDGIASLVAREIVAFRTVLATTTANVAAHAVTDDSSGPGELSSDLARARAAVGASAYALAASLTRPATGTKTLDRLAPFSRLSPTEVAALPARMQFNVPTLTCAQLSARDPIFLTDERFLAHPVTACDNDRPNV